MTSSGLKSFTDCRILALKARRYIDRVVRKPFGGILLNYLETQEFMASVAPIRKRPVFHAGAAVVPSKPRVCSLWARRFQATQDQALC